MVGFAALPQHPSLLDGVAAPASPDDGTAAGTGERKRRRRKRDVQVYPRARRRRCRRAPRGDRHGCAGPPPRRLWSSVVQQAKNAIAETQRVRTLLDVARNPSVLDTGQKIVASLEARLESFGYRRSLQQREFHDAFIRACLPHIYGLDYFDRHKRRILKRHGLKRMRSEVLCLTPRRFGKTTAVAMFAAAALLEIPDIVLAIFSTGSRASGGLMQQIVGLLSNHARDEFQARKLKQNNEQLFLSSAADSALGGGKGRAVGASLYSFPASGDTLRGVSPKVCILEEASHIDSSIFNTVIVPLLGVKYTAVLAISTPDTEFNYYSALLEMKDPETGDTLFKTIRFELVCDRCKNSGDAVSCTHMDHKLPRWKSSKTQAKMAAILADDPELNARENKGIIITNTRFIFNAKMVRALLEAPRLPLAQGAATRPLSVTMCVDPSGGGSGSDYAVCSTMVLQDGSIVVSLPPSFLSLTRATTRTSTCARCRGGVRRTRSAAPRAPCSSASPRAACPTCCKRAPAPRSCRRRAAWRRPRSCRWPLAARGRRRAHARS